MKIGQHLAKLCHEYNDPLWRSVLVFCVTL